MREAVGIDGRHYRIDPQDATTLQVQPRYRAHWVKFATCPDADTARGWLAILGDHRQPQPDMTQLEGGQP